jgi:regulator of sirC expression with transglutaminase-like and TPR domain
MPGIVPLEAPTSLGYFASLVADDVTLPLLEAAASIAEDDFPGLDIQSVLAEIDELGARLRRRIPADAVPLQRLRWLNRFFFIDLGFGANLNNYYAASNSYLNEVLRTRKGIPVSLAVVYAELAAQIGLRAQGVSFPGHFLVKLSLAGSRQGGEVVIDPVSGQSLSREELDEMLGPYKASRGLVGDFEVPLGLFLQAATPREVIARMLRNLKEIHGAAEDWPRLLAVMDRLVILMPQAHEERRDRALVSAELGQTDAAIRDLESYLGHRPDADDHAAMAQRLSEMRRAR